MHALRAAALVASAALTAVLVPAGAAVAAPPEPRPAVATADRPVTSAENDRVPEGAAWTQHYFTSADGSGTELHADVLRPEGLPEGERVPVVLSVGPYFGHAGEVAPEGWTHSGPSDRFTDLLEGADLLARGYALVMVDSRGYGGSSGCLQFGGPAEDADVTAAIEWAATQPWATGAVGMYGKSYDAMTGLAGTTLGHDALGAVVAQEPLWDPVRNFWSGDVPRTTIVDVPRTYGGTATMPPLPDADPRYAANAVHELTHPECLAENTLGFQVADPGSEHWAARDLAARAEGSETPLLFTQGFLEWNTEAEGMQEYLAVHDGPQRGWLGPWDHVRGNEVTADGRLAMGREGWFEEVVSFYDEHLKGVEPTATLPAFAVQDSTGAWREQDTWPVADRTATVDVGGGTYTDDGEVSTYVTRSEPLTGAVRLTGTPRVTLEAQGRGNVLVQLHDVAPDGTAVMFDEQASVLQPGETSVELRSTDWTLAAGHALAVEVGTVTPGGDWIDTPSGEVVEVIGARLDVALDDPADDVPTAGGAAPFLDTHRAVWASTPPVGPATFTLPSARG